MRIRLGDIYICGFIRFEIRIYVPVELSFVFLFDCYVFQYFVVLGFFLKGNRNITAPDSVNGFDRVIWAPLLYLKFNSLIAYWMWRRCVLL